MHLRHHEIWLWLCKLRDLDDYEGPDLMQAYAAWNALRTSLEVVTEEPDEYQELVEEEAVQLESMDKALYRMCLYN
jgi:hypothetical protein